MVEENATLLSELTIENEEYGNDILKECKLVVAPLTLNSDIEGKDLIIENEEYNNDIFEGTLNALQIINKEINSNVNIDIESLAKDVKSTIDVRSNFIKYIGTITGYIGVDPNLVQADIYSSIKVNRTEGVVKYVGYINGSIDLTTSTIEEDEIGFDCSIHVPQVMYDKTINGALLVIPEICSRYIEGTADIAKKNYMGEFDGYFLYEADTLDTDILSSMNVIQAIWEDISGDVNIEAESFSKDILSKIEVNGISIVEDLCKGNVTMDQYIEKNKDLWANMQYISMPYTSDESNTLTGKVTINNWSSRYDINSRLRVPCHRILYTFLSKLKAVYGSNYDIPSNITISSDHVYDIDALVNLEYTDYENEQLLEGNIHIDPHEWKDIDSEVYLDKVDTRRDFDSNMFVVQPVDKYITSTITVKNQYKKLNKTIDSIIRVGNEYAMSFESSMSVEAALQQGTDIISSMEVTNQLMPGRVVFFTDPLWQYEPYVLKNTVSTFLERIFLTTYLTVVYGGSPRANWDIKHFCGVYRIPPERQIEVPFDFLPGNPLATKNSMIRFVHRMFRFRPNDPHKQVDKVFVFSNNPYAHNSTYLNPLFEACRLYKIPITVITSKGEFVGSDPTNPERYINRTPVDHNLPLDAQPHWQYGAGTKHREVFDDRPIV